MKATEIVEKLKSVLLSSDETVDVSVTEEVSQVEVNEPLELEAEQAQLEEDGAEAPVEEVVEEVKYATKDELDSAIAEMKAMYDKIMENMGSEAMETEVPSEELSTEEPQKEELSSQEDGAEPIAHSPEAEAEPSFRLNFSQNRARTTKDRVFSRISTIN